MMMTVTKIERIPNNNNNNNKHTNNYKFDN